VLAAAAGMAAGWGVGALAPGRSQETERRWGDRLVKGGRRFKSYSCTFGGLLTGPSPVDRARTGSKHHVLTDARGLPLALTLTGGNRNDITQLLPLIDGVKPVAGKVGRPRKRPKVLLADRGYDHDKYRREVWARGIKPVIARRSTPHGSGLGRQRWVVERTFTWLHQFRRLRIRWERDPQQHLALLYLAVAIICWRRLRSL
jgi:transposase